MAFINLHNIMLSSRQTFINWYNTHARQLYELHMHKVLEFGQCQQ
jgi:hypothetical protein